MFKKLHDQLKTDNLTLFIALGYLCYKLDLKNFTTTYGNFKKNKLACVIGNHDSKENGNSKITKEALEYWGIIGTSKLQIIPL